MKSTIKLNGYTASNEMEKTLPVVKEDAHTEDYMQYPWLQSFNVFLNEWSALHPYWRVTVRDNYFIVLTEDGDVISFRCGAEDFSLYIKTAWHKYVNERDVNVTENNVKEFILDYMWGFRD
ncbi:MAG: hypothetical protein EKK57_08310 [Proteobacteria bacterium]|nr:MAG: hypothetical protein EKK57_08310 [Pseudomonadota bacterium]